MASVTQRIKSIKQPYGGYLPVKHFSKETLNDGIILNAEENIHSSLVGTAVDYLTRLMLGNSVEKSFHISFLGALQIGLQHKAEKLKAQISGLDNSSIVAACKLAGFDVCYRSSNLGYKPIEDINPDNQTIENIRMMVNRSLSFWRKYGPVTYSEPTFEGGYSDTVNTGDGDYVTKDTLWDFKVSKNPPTSKHTLQILMYYVMGLHSVHDYFKQITKLGFFNPRLNIVYLCSVSTIPKETIEKIENDVICYSVHKSSNTNQHSFFHDTPSKHSFSVTDICQITGQKKSTIYSDIRSGKLVVAKKGNKYSISAYEFNRYVEFIKKQQKTQLIIVAFALGAIIFLFLIIIFGNYF